MYTAESLMRVLSPASVDIKIPPKVLCSIACRGTEGGTNVKGNLVHAYQCIQMHMLRTLDEGQKGQKVRCQKKC